MPVHDWSLVEPAIYHAFHTAWLGVFQTCLNEGLLPEGYYALAEQHAGRSIADVLTLHASSSSPSPLPLPPATGGTAVAESPPRVRRKETIEATALSRRRSLAVRHVSGHRLVGLIEVASPSNKDRRSHVEEFAAKAVAALDAGVHFLLIDLILPGPHDPHGLHEIIFQRLGEFDEAYELPEREPLTLASYVAGEQVDIYLEHVAIGALLPEMPLFLRPDRYINLPLQPWYDSAYNGMPVYWRQVLEG